MSIQNLISEDIKKAMLAREVDKLAALRSVKAAILLEASKDGSSEVSDDIALKIIIKLVKQRKDSAQIYKEQNRHDLESDELKQLEYLELYLPEQLSKDKIEIIITKIIVDVNASTMKDMGRVMGLASKELGGKADGKLIAQIVKEKLS
ncbi:MAG: GatB/YqeY domain-containing protein [Flavobacteriales bacterium]|nr:GatB/YqeY domain-containing protein [Flavobacteriales bacterium]